MYNINFIPNWYKDKCVNKIKNIFRILITVLLFMDAVVLFMLYKGNIRLAAISKRSEVQEQSIKAEAPSVKTIQVTNLTTIESYNYILKYFNEKVNYLLLDITEKDIIIEAEAIDMENYIDFVKIVELDKKFLVKHISMPEVKEEKIYFKMVVTK